MPDPLRAIAEIHRVLRPGGEILFAHANPERPDFIPSPHSIRYFSADELRLSLESHGFSVRTLAGFPTDPSSAEAGSQVRTIVLSSARRIASALGLIPKTLKGRARLKKLIFGRLITVPAELHRGFAPVIELEEQPAGPVTTFKVFYTAAKR